MNFTPVGGRLAASLLLAGGAAGCNAPPDSGTLTKTVESKPALAQSQNSVAKPKPKQPAPRAAKTWKAPPLANWTQGQIIRHVPVKAGRKVFALTFDDGPWPHATRRILQILRERKVKATFFMLGQEVRNYPEIARAVRDEGHAIGNHSWNHPSRPRDARAQIERTNAEIKKAVGFTPNLFRPPYGLVTNGMTREAMKENMAVILWSSDSRDWAHPGSAAMIRTVLQQASPGGIALLHDGGGHRSQTIAALPVIIERLQARGYKFVTVPELLAMRHVAPKKSAKQKKTTPSRPSSTRIRQ